MKITIIGIFYIMVLARSANGCNDFIIKENSASICDKDPIKIEIVYQTIAIDNLKGSFKCYLKSDIIDARIHIDIYVVGKLIYSTVLEKSSPLIISLEYLTDKLSYISWYYDENDISCPQKYELYNLHNLINSGGVAVSKVMEGQLACFEFPTEDSEVVWPVNSNFQEYCKCTKEVFENGCDCYENKLFDVIFHNGKVCFKKKLQHVNQIAIFFQETKNGGCGSDCDFIALLQGHRIDVSSVAPFSFQYNQLKIDDAKALIAWFEASCGEQTRYEFIEVKDSILTSHLLLHQTFTSVSRSVPASRYYIRAQSFDNSLCTTSNVSLEIPVNVITKVKVLHESSEPTCLRPPSTSSAVIMPKEGSNHSCICTNMIDIEHCSCIEDVEFDVFYNSELDNPLCISNITQNNTRIHFMSQYLNSLNDQIDGFPLFNQVILDSINFVVPKKSGSECDENHIKIELIYQTLEIDYENSYLKCFFKSNQKTDQEILVDVYESDKITFSKEIHKDEILQLQFKYLTGKNSYISLYYSDRKDILCPQEIVNYSVYHLIQDYDISVLQAMRWQPTCFEFPKKTAEVVWPIDSNFNEYCICEQDKLQSRNGCECPESKLFDVTINDDGNVCFNATMQDNIPVAIYFQETKVNGCGNGCDLIILLRGHRIDISQTCLFSLRYNEFIINRTNAFITWNKIQCGEQTQYEVVEAGARNSGQMVGHNTFTSVKKHSPPSIYFLRALHQDNSSCCRSEFSLQVPNDVTTQYIALNTTNDSACISPSTLSSIVILPQMESNNSCICSKLMLINQCKCFDTVQFNAFYNSSSNNPLCFYNVTTNNTCILFVSQTFNPPNDIRGFPRFNREILDSFCFVTANISQSSHFSFQYNKFNFNHTKAFFAWFGIQCGQQTQYEVVEAGARNLRHNVGHNTFISVEKHSPPSRYYVRALDQDNSLCARSAFSLQVPTDAITKYIVLNENDPICIRPSSLSSGIIMPQQSSNNSCTCPSLDTIDQCSCIDNVQFEVFYNTSSNNPLCFYNITRNETCILFNTKNFNTPNYIREGFPLSNQEILDSFCFVTASYPMPPTVINYLNKNKSVCFMDTFDGFSNITSYLLILRDITGFGTNVTYNKTESNCHVLPYSNSCGSLEVTIWSKNEIGLSLPKTLPLESNYEGQVCHCFIENVNISLNTSERLELTCETHYVNFTNTAQFEISFEEHSEIPVIKMNCSSINKIPPDIFRDTGIVHWKMSGPNCEVSREKIFRTKSASISTDTILGSTVGSIIILLITIEIIIT